MEQDKNTESLRSDLARDGQEFFESVSRLFNKEMSETLDILSSRFPHTKGDGSQNENEFLGLRAKILRSGNNKIRALREVMADYIVVKTHDTVVASYDVKPDRTVTRKDKE